MIRNPCVCNDEEGMHDKDTRVCTQRYCRCLKFIPLFSRQGVTKKQDVHKTAADMMQHRASYYERQSQKQL